MATFETVATFNDKKNGNSNKVSVNIAMLPLKKKLMKKQITSHLAAGSQIIKSGKPLAEIPATTALPAVPTTTITAGDPSRPLQPPQPVHLRVDKATLTDPEAEHDEDRGLGLGGCQNQKQKGVNSADVSTPSSAGSSGLHTPSSASSGSGLRTPSSASSSLHTPSGSRAGSGSSSSSGASLVMAGRLHSVIQSLKSVFSWTTHSISGGMKNSESFLLDNGSRRRGYNPLTCDNNNMEAGAVVTSGAAASAAASHRAGSTVSSSSSRPSSASMAPEDNWSNEWAPSSHLPSPISEMDEDSDHSWDDEEVTCNVCDRAFTSPRQLEYHQHKKRHWGCNSCDSLFSTLMTLENHKDFYEHWSDDEFDESEDSDDDDIDDDFELYDLDEEYIQSLQRSQTQECTAIHHQDGGKYHERIALLM